MFVVRRLIAASPGSIRPFPDSPANNQHEPRVSALGSCFFARLARMSLAAPQAESAELKKRNDPEAVGPTSGSVSRDYPRCVLVVRARLERRFAWLIAVVFVRSASKHDSVNSIRFLNCRSVPISTSSTFVNGAFLSAFIPPWQYVQRT